MFRWLANLFSHRVAKVEPVKLVEVRIKLIGITEEELRPAVSSVAVHLNDHYRKLGGNGLRTIEPEEDFPLSVEIIGVQDKNTGVKRYEVTLRLVPRSSEDSPKILALTQNYISSSEFREWWLSHTS